MVHVHFITKIMHQNKIILTKTKFNEKKTTKMQSNVTKDTD